MESCIQDFSDLDAEYKVLEVSVPMFEEKGMIWHDYWCLFYYFELL